MKKIFFILLTSFLVLSGCTKQEKKPKIPQAPIYTYEAKKEAVYHTNLGNKYSNKGEIDKSIKEYKTAIKIDPKYSLPHVCLAISYEQKRKYKEALEEYETALKLQPGRQDCIQGINRIKGYLKPKSETKGRLR